MSLFCTLWSASNEKYLPMSTAPLLFFLKLSMVYTSLSTNAQYLQLLNYYYYYLSYCVFLWHDIISCLKSFCQFYFACVRGKMWWCVCVLQETWWALLLLSLLPVGRPFYVPGVAPRDFRDAETVDIKVRLKLIWSTFCRLAGTLWYGWFFCLLPVPCLTEVLWTQLESFLWNLDP